MTQNWFVVIVVVVIVCVIVCICVGCCQARIQSLHIIKKFYTRPDLSDRIEVRNCSIIIVIVIVVIVIIIIIIIIALCCTNITISII